MANGGGTGGSGGAPGGGVGGSGGAGGGAGGSGGSGSADGGTVDSSTMNLKHLIGYQGWHLAAGDGSPINGWKHWFTGNTPTTANLHIDLWPDTSELGSGELFATQINTRPLFSAYKAATVARHFAWMKTYGLDGVFLQRFLNEVETTSGKAFRDQVTLNTMAGAAASGRVFAIMYDISGAASTWVADLKADWKHLVNDLHVTQSDRHLKHNGKPVVAIWGIGFTDRPGTATEAQDVINWFKSGVDNPAPVTLVGGVPTNWRTSNGDSKAGFSTVYASFDILSPWSVGRYVDDTGANSFKTAHIDPDMTAVGAAKYLPVIWPGYSFHNASGGAQALNQIPRRRGAFYWRQAHNAVAAGCTMLYTAMFDEVDEGTAIYKMAATAADVPPAAQSVLLDLNVDDPTNSNPIKNDWYLKLAHEASRVLRGEITNSLTPPTPY